MSAHTPGPWRRTVYEHGGSRIFAGDERYQNLIADTYQRGDADLFFYAPELLEALKTALLLIENGDFSNGVGEYGQDEGVTMTAPLIAQIEAAIAKAEGR